MGFKTVAAAVGLAGLMTSFGALAADKPVAATAKTRTVELKDAKGKSVGKVTVEQTPHGLLLHGDLSGLPEGEHAFHVHMVGKCEAPFKTAGDHFNPTGKHHGMKDPGGMHAGDMPNVVVPASGAVKFEVLAPNLTLDAGPNSVLDADGSAIVLHAKADDYASQPAGAAGDRIACGVLAK